MFRATDSFATPAGESAIPFEAWIADLDRRLIAMDARWLVLGETEPVAEPMSDYAARSLMRSPSIVWG